MVAQTDAAAEDFLQYNIFFQYTKLLITRVNFVDVFYIMDKMGGMFSFLSVSIYCCISLIIYRQWNLSIFNQIVEDETQNSMDTGAELEKLKLEIKDKVRERVT